MATYYQLSDGCKAPIYNKKKKYWRINRKSGETCTLETYTPETQYQSSALDVLVSTDYTGHTLTAAFIMFAIGLGVGQVLKFIGKLR